MPAFGPISHADLVRGLKALGFSGPHAGGKHLYMVRDGQRLTIPNPHKGDIRPSLLIRILAQAGHTRQDWEQI
jgi:predicted RNA binding protein YcfA (HicA-like mRNA interferase family)